MKTELQDVEIVHRDESYAVGFSGDFTMEARSEIPKLWNRFFEAGPSIENAVSGGMYGISYNADMKGNFSYAVAVGVNPVPTTLPEGTCKMILSGGGYAVLRAFGPVTELPGVFDSLFSKWMPSSDWSPREGAVFEFYPEDERNGPDGMAYEIWAPVGQ